MSKLRPLIDFIEVERFSDPANSPNYTTFTFTGPLYFHIYFTRFLSEKSNWSGLCYNAFFHEVLLEKLCMRHEVVEPSYHFQISLYRASSFCFVYSQPNTAHGYIIVLEEVSLQCFSKLRSRQWKACTSFVKGDVFKIPAVKQN